MKRFWLLLGTSLWIGFHDDLADPGSDDPVLRQSTRLTCMAVMGAQSTYDPRVIKAESDDIVEAVKKNGVPVEYVVFPDEGHGFTKRENKITASNAYVAFLDQHLKQPGAPKGE